MRRHLKHKPMFATKAEAVHTCATLLAAGGSLFLVGRALGFW